MKIGFIGPGKVGVNLGRYFIYKNLKLSGFYGRNKLSTQYASNITNSKFYENIQDIIKDSDILFITTPDDYISIIDNEISQYDLTSKIICHTSGSLNSFVLSNSELSGADIYSIHPMYAFSNKNLNLKDLEKINFSIESKSFKEDSPIICLMNKLGNKYFIRKDYDSSDYHLANVFVSNLVLSLLEVGTSYLKKIGLTEKEALDAIYPLVIDNVNGIARNGFVNSLTGPVARGDINTIKKHLSVIKPEDEKIYKLLSLNLLKLVALKKDDSNIKENALKSLINNSENHSEIYKLLGGFK